MHQSYWSADRDRRRWPSLDRNLDVDVVVVGGGITGATAAYLIKQSGRSVALMERDRCGGGDTSHTSAHLTAVTDRTFSSLLAELGRHHAEAVWDAGFAALHEISQIIAHHEIDCGFRWIPGYLTTRFDRLADDDVVTLAEVVSDATDSGFDAETTAVPRLGLPAAKFDHQARFRPMEYLDALLRLVDGNGSFVFEQTGVTSVDDDPLVVRCDGGAVSTRMVVIATHVPIMGKTGLVKAALLQADLYPYSSYVIGARVERDLWPDALVWDLSDPYYFLRLDQQDDHDVLILGGCDHKTGQLDETRQPFDALTALLHRWEPDARVTHRWSGQVVETRDRLPYIGEIAPGQFVITGFGGNGITFGTVGAMMARDLAIGRANPWSALFDANRTHVTKGLWHYVRENADYPYYLIRDRFHGSHGRDLRSVPAGHGRLIDLRGHRVAAYRHANGTLSVLSPVCPHLGCHVAWNKADSTWDCPCHGSRFSPEGRVLAGPAEQDLREWPSVDSESTH
jgi:glycine/D-amino acid oxidase-like deaminating enzyme/nitrite reductase/ring-hydroxylating ferredoxin subunit